MEFRRYFEGGWPPRASSSIDIEMENSENNSNFLRRAIYLPPRSLLLLSGEARYAWHHYIPHHKVYFTVYKLSTGSVLRFCLLIA